MSLKYILINYFKKFFIKKLKKNDLTFLIIFSNFYKKFSKMDDK